MATVTASLTLAGRLPWDVRREARCDRDGDAPPVRVASCGPVRAPLWARAGVLGPSALVLSGRAGTALAVAAAADSVSRRPPATPSGPPLSALGRLGGMPGADGPAPGLAGAVQTPVARPSPSACQVCVEVTSAAGSLPASIEYPGSVSGPSGRS